MLEGINIKLNRAGDIFIETLPGYKGREDEKYEQYILEKRRGQYREECE